MAEYFDTRRGNKGLRVNGHIFVKEKANKRTINWSCLLNKKFRCRARVKLKFLINSIFTNIFLLF